MFNKNELIKVQENFFFEFLSVCVITAITDYMLATNILNFHSVNKLHHVNLF